MHTFQRGSQTLNVDIALMYDDTDLSAIVFEKKSKTMNLFCFVVCKNNWTETFFFKSSFLFKDKLQALCLCHLLKIL